MKKIVFGILVGILFVFASCSDDDGYSLGDIWIGFGIYKGDSESYESIIMDNKDELVPVAATNPNWHERFENGDRVLVNYTILDEDETSSEHPRYYVKINNIDDILMKGIFEITPETEDSIGNDPIIVEDYWMTDSLLSFKLKYWGLNEIHFLNLVKEPGEISEREEPIMLELRHNANNAPQSVLYTSFVSFSLNSLRKEGQDSVEFKVVSTDYEDVEHTLELTFNYEGLEWPTP